MKRDDFGDWSQKLDEAGFWQALALLGILGADTPEVPKDAETVEKILSRISLPGIGVPPSNELPGLAWRIRDEYVSSARRQELVDASWLLGRWNNLRAGGLIYERFFSEFRFSNQQEIIAAFKKHLNAVIYFRLRDLSSAGDWQWPLRFSIPRARRYDHLREGLRGWQQGSEVVSKLVRFSDADVQGIAEFLVLYGMPSDASGELNNLAVPIRAHCLFLLTEEEIEIDLPQGLAVLWLQQRTLAKGIVIVNIRNSDPSEWLVNLLYEMSHNQPIDQLLKNLLPGAPVLFFDPALFRIARIGTFATRILNTLESASSTDMEVSANVASGISLKPGSHPARRVASSFREVLNSPYAFDQEIRGSTWTVEIMQSALRQGILREARSRAAAERGPEEPRRLQVDITERQDRKPVRYLYHERRYAVEAWIGTQEGLLSGIAFPEQLLPWEEPGHLLTITFYAPGFMAEPMVETIYLPRAGESSRCRFFFETNSEEKRFAARITIAYANRILQTYLLRGEVVERNAEIPIELIAEMATQGNWQGLDRQRSYGANIVLNEMHEKHLAVVQCGYKALPFSLDGLSDAMTEMESKIDESKWDKPEFKGLQGEASRELILYLAKHGFTLLDAVKQYVPSGESGKAFLENLLRADPIQVLAANLGARLPIEFFYANPYPADNAQLCPTYEADTDRASCEGCAHVDGSHYCPLGFWSLRKVLEWHDFEQAKKHQKDFAPREFAIEGKDPDLKRDQLAKVDKVLIGISQKAGQVDPQSVDDMVANIRKAGIDPMVVTDWADWMKKIQEGGVGLLVLIPHTLKNKFNEDELEICGEAITAASITAQYVAAGRHPGPVVLLLGCNTENLGAPFRNFPVKFMSGGSALVVSTIAHLLGRHAAPLAAELVCEIVAAQKAGQSTFGEVMRKVRRDWLRKNQPPISLGLKCYGDARWRF